MDGREFLELIAKRPTDFRQSETTAALLIVLFWERIVPSGSIHCTSLVDSVSPLHHKPVELVMLAVLS